MESEHCNPFGDTMMALAYDYVMKAPEKVRTEVFSVFSKTAIEVCEGQHTI